MVRFFILSFFAICLSGCASAGFNVLDISALSSDQDNNGSFEGIERLAEIDPEDSRKVRVNIIYLHGIGYIENPDDAPLANNFIKGIADAYGLDLEDKTVASRCGRDDKNESVELTNSIRIKAVQPKTYKTTLPGSTLGVDDLACMDKQVLEIDENMEYVFYRVFWDDIFWESLQNPHVGQDAIGKNEDGLFSNIRTKYNGYLKDKLVNYGFSDAVLYLGPAGEDIRNGVRGAMCSAALDASGFTLGQQGKVIDHESICGMAANQKIETDPFAFVTESLGSKIAFDIMREAMTDGRGNVYDRMIKGTQFFMLANQIPLLSLADISETERMVPEPYANEDRPTIIALSEVNDFLTYELVPFYRQLLERSDRSGESIIDLSIEGERAKLINLLGFNVIDMRVEFAGPLIPVVGQFFDFVDPLYAHNGAVQQPEVIAYMLCGAEAGQLNTNNCRGLRSPNLKGKKFLRTINLNEDVKTPISKGEAARRSGL